jgi:hypothetical protein
MSMMGLKFCFFELWHMADALEALNNCCHLDPKFVDDRASV